MNETKFPLPKKLILDYSKWRCGGLEKAKHRKYPIVGNGFTMLLNQEGYMCCLGQFSEQAGVPATRLINECVPNELRINNELSGIVNGHYVCSSFACEALEINDMDSPVLYKIKELTRLCEQHEYELEVVNLPPELNAVKLIDNIIDEANKIAQHNIDKAIDYLYDNLEPLIETKKTAIDEWFDYASYRNIRQLQIEVVIAVLTITLPLKSHYKNRPLFFSCVKREFTGFTSELFNGLE